VIRPGVEADRAFILDSWLRGLWALGAYPLPHDRFFAAFRPTVTELLEHPEVLVLVSAEDDDPSKILAYLAYTPGPRPAIHWCHVRPSSRRRGLAAALLQAAELGPRTSYTLSSRAAHRVTRGEFTPSRIRHLLSPPKASP
jgi:GNAT superfamily N-acetyltransferase